ncbi:MAG: ABC transporter ATP-binding protein [Lachnospiraceae bacterium]
MLKRIYSLSDKGASNLRTGILLTTLHQLSVMFPVPLLVLLTGDMIRRLNGERTDSVSFFPYFAASLLLLLIIYLIYLKNYNQRYMTSGAEGANIRLTMAEKFRRLPLSYLGERDLSDLSSALMDDVSTVENVLTNDVSNVFAGVFSSVIGLVVLFFFNWKMALSLSVCLPVSLLIIFLSRYATEPTNRKNRSVKLGVSEGVQEFLENIKVIKSSPQKSKYLSALEKKIRRVVPWAVLYEVLVGIFLSLSYNALRIGLGLVIITGSALLISGGVDVLTFLAFLFAAVRIYDPLTDSIFKAGVFIQSLVAAGRVRAILDYPEQDGSENIKPEEFDVTYENVRFGYNQKDVIKGVSFVAKQGEITALVGPSGCGKSTLCKLACRFWDVSQGAVKIGRENVREIAPETLLQNYSIVFQDVILFNDTIYNNIKIGNKDATEKEIFEAAKLARCDTFVERLAEGYQTVIGENGQTLSGGERQRISIARAFLKKAPIVLLDEATASLDPENETLIQQAIGELIQGKTVIVIAHRLRTVEYCDKIVVLDDGQVSAMGTHEQLMEEDGLYKHLYTLQKATMRWGVKE